MSIEPAASGAKVIQVRYEPAPINIDIPPAKLSAGYRSTQKLTQLPEEKWD